jgi:hypothetical protein
VAEFAAPETGALIAALRKRGFTMQAAAPPVAAGGAFAGQTWCVTGSFETFKPRDRAKDEIKKRGGRVVEAVSSSTTHLLAGEKAGSKLTRPVRSACGSSPKRNSALFCDSGCHHSCGLFFRKGPWPASAQKHHPDTP